MKKRISALILAMALIFAVSAAAATPRAVNPIDVASSVSASSSGVTCSIRISAPPGSNITASGTVALYRNDGYVTSWAVNSLNFAKTYTPALRGDYRMDYSITVKGSAGTDNLSGSEYDTY